MDKEFSDFERAQLIDLMVAARVPRKDAETVVRDKAAELDRALTALADHPYNKASAGAPKTVIGSHHFRFRKAVLTTMALTASLTASGIALVGFLPAGIAGIAATVANAILAYSSQVTKLTGDEFRVFDMILKEVEDKKQGLTAGSSAKNISDRFRLEKQAPPSNIANILASMESKELLRITATGPDLHYAILK